MGRVKMTELARNANTLDYGGEDQALAILKAWSSYDASKMTAERQRGSVHT